MFGLCLATKRSSAFFGASASVGALFYCAKVSVVGKFNNRRKEKMADFEKMYFELFNGITDAIEQLKELQQKAEKLYIEHKEEK